MTYREKLQKEHPECVNECYYGGCNGCPGGYGYGPEECCGKACLGYSKENCTACWNKVIPGTEEKLTFKIPTNLDEMIEYFEAHGFNAYRSYSDLTDIYQFKITKGNRCTIDISFKYPQGKSEVERGAVMLDYCERLIVKFDNDVLETKQSCINDLCKAVDKRDKEIEILKKQITKLEQKNETYSNVCAIYKSKDAIIEKQEKEIKVLKADNAAADIIIKERDQKIQKLEGACSAKNAEILRLDKELKEEKTRKYFWCEDNCCAMVKDKEIQRLSKLLGDRDDEIQELKRKNENQAEYIRRAKVTFVERDKQIDELQQKLKHAEANVAAYQLMARSSFGTLCPCHCSGCDAKDKKIKRLENDLEYERSNRNDWYNECHRLVKKINELENSNQELKDALAKEKSEHAKHHGFFGYFHVD